MCWRCGVLFGEIIVSTIHHKYWNAVRWLFVYYVFILMLVLKDTFSYNKWNKFGKDKAAFFKLWL